MSLQSKLDAITQEVRQLVQPEKLEVHDRAILDLMASGIADGILAVGDQGPDFVLPDANGKPVRSSDLLAIGKLVIDFFRGRWCPYCVTELETYAALYPRIRGAGALLVAISPQTIRQNDFTVQQHGIKFPLLSDSGNSVARKFGLTYQVPAYHQQHFRNVLVNLPFINGDPSWELSLPATYVLDRGGVVLYASGFADFRKRPDPEQVLQAVWE